MGSWAAIIADTLWRNAVAVVPLVLIVAALCRFFPRRPATRHTLWLVVLIWLIVPPILPTFQAGPVATNNSEPSQLAAAPTVVGEGIAPPKAKVSGADRFDSPVAVDLPGPGTMRSKAKTPNVASRRTQYQRTPTPPWTGTEAEPGALRHHTPSHRSGRSPSYSWRANRPPITAPPRDIPSQSVAIQFAESAAEDCLGLPPLNLKLPGATSEPQHAQVGRPAPNANEEPSIAAMTAEPDKFKTASRSSESHGSRVGELRPATEGPPAENAASNSVADLSRQWVVGFVAVRDAVGRLPSVPIQAWIIGVFAALAIRVMLTVNMRRRLRTAKPAPESVRSEVRAAARHIGLRRVPPTWMVVDRFSPMIWCGRSPRLLLPATLWSQLDRVGRRAVLLHELAHLRRRDHVVAWLESFVGCLFWWHPVVWWIRRQVREEAENCCDAWVMWLMPRGRRAYAEALVTTREYVSSPPLVSGGASMGIISGRARQFSRRLTMVMTDRSAPKGTFSGFAVAAALMATGWLATPAQSCPEDKSADGESKAKQARSVAVVAPDAPTAGHAIVDAPGAPRNKMGPTVAVAPVAPKAPLLVTAPPAPAVLATPIVSVGPSSGPDDDSDRDLHRRLDRLERRLERLAESLERREERSPRARESRDPRPPRPQTIAPMPPRPDAQFEKKYVLSGEKLARLTRLMSRDDVPVLIRPADDGIVVIGSHGQHMIFGAFVDMITIEDDDREYHLSPGKLEELTNLMVLDDVPVLVAPDEDHIHVHGNGAVQAVFDAFVQLIEPAAHRVGHQRTIPDEKGRQRRHKRKSQQAPKEYSQWKEAAIQGRAQYSRSAEQYRDAARAARLAMEQAMVSRRLSSRDVEKEIREVLNSARKALKESHGRAADEVRQKAKSAERAARELEREAEELERRADELRRRVEQMREQAADARGAGPCDAILAEADVLEARADDLMAGSEALFARVDAVDSLVDELDALIDMAEEDAEAEYAEFSENDDGEDDEAEDVEDGTDGDATGR